MLSAPESEFKGQGRKGGRGGEEGNRREREEVGEEVVTLQAASTVRLRIMSGY